MLKGVRTSRLPNGVRVVTSALPHLESVSVGLWAGVGGRHERAALSGISHFIEHLLFKGTIRRSARAISQAIEGRGGYLNAFTQEESTCYYARIAADYTWHAFDVLADMYLNPRFAAGDIERERGVIAEEIMMYRDQPQHAVQEMLRGQLWKDHALGRGLAGTPETVAAMQRRDILAFKRARYVGANTVAAFAGKVKHDVCVARVARAFGRLPRRLRSRGTRVRGKTRVVRIGAEQRDIEQSHLTLGFRIFGRNDERRYALKILSAVLGENMSSRLFQLLREKHGMAYAVHSGSHMFRDTGAFVISAGLEKTKTGKALSLVLRELNRLRTVPVGSAELKRAKDYAIGQLRLGLESTSYQMIWIGENLMTFGRFIAPDLVVEKLRHVTASEIQKLAGAIFRRAASSVACIAPAPERKTRDDIARCLAAL